MNAQLENLLKKARLGAKTLLKASTKEKNDALNKMADFLEAKTEYIISENKKDISHAKENGINDIMVDRLSLDETRIKAMADGVRDVAKLDDPIGQVDGMTRRPNGLLVGKKRTPFGVVAIIFEARPNVTSDAAALCLKTSNAVILRGGKEAILSTTAIVSVMREALKTCGMEDAVSLIEDISHDTANELMRANDYVDLLIPRGGRGLIQSVVKNATVPVIETGTGNCHIYVEKSADFNMARDIIVNAKTSRPSVCNAAESLVIDEAIAKEFLPIIVKALKEKGVKLLGCDKSVAISLNEIEKASEEDFGREFLDYIMSVKVVKNIDEAIEHISKYSTGHSECIVTNDYNASQQFLNEVDSAAVYVNASTRFTDGFEFGFGAEIGISTQKLHARGPMGLMELTTYKYIIYGQGQIR